METRKLEDLTPHPQADLVPDASAEEDLALVADVKENGVYYPIMHAGGRIIDGHRRFRAAKKAGLIEVPVVERTGLTEDEELELLVKLNGNRRQWGRESRQETAGRLRERGWSYRRIAGVLGVGKSTVERWINELSQTGQLDQPEKVEGADGKSRPAKKPTPRPTEKKAPGGFSLSEFGLSSMEETDGQRWQEKKGTMQAARVESSAPETPPVANATVDGEVSQTGQLDEKTPRQDDPDEGPEVCSECGRPL